MNDDVWKERAAQDVLSFLDRYWPIFADYQCLIEICNIVLGKLEMMKKAQMKGNSNEKS